MHSQEAGIGWPRKWDRGAQPSEKSIRSSRCGGTVASVHVREARASCSRLSCDYSFQGACNPLGLQIDWGHVRAARTLAALMNTVELNALELLCLRRNQKSLQSCWPADACCTLNFGSDSMGVSMADDISISNRVTVNHSSKQPQHMFLPQGTFTLSMCSR